MRPIRRTLAIDASIVVLAAASVAELWIGHRADATMVTTVLALGTSASLLTWRSSPVAAIVAASAAQAALLGEMPRPMISSVVALGVAAVIAGVSTVGPAPRGRWAEVVGGVAMLLVGADYAFRIRTSGQIAAFVIVVASLAVLWAFGHRVVRRLTPPPAGAPAALADASPASSSRTVPSSSLGASSRLAPPSSSVPAAASAQPSTPTQRRVRDAAAKKAAVAKNDAATPEDAELDARRLAVARDLAGTVTAGLNAVLVETVAAQQGLVRDAHPEDVLIRVRAAEEHARTAIDDVRRLLTVAAVVPAADNAVVFES